METEKHTPIQAWGVNLMDYLLGETEEKLEFTIDNDQTADWAVEKVLETIAERDRLIGLADARIQELQEKKRQLTEKADRRTQYLTNKLYDYFQTVEPSSVTKTQTTYKLLSGKLVQKKQQPEYERNEEQMLAWARDFAPAYVQTKESVAWGELKKATTVNGETVVLAETGEVVNGVIARARDDVFEVSK